MSWLPIETAPRDENSILIATPERGVTLGRWNVAYEQWEIINMNFHKPEADFYDVPTHWMPLPNPPGVL